MEEELEKKEDELEQSNCHKCRLKKELEYVEKVLKAEKKKHKKLEKKQA